MSQAQFPIFEYDADSARYGRLQAQLATLLNNIAILACIDSARQVEIVRCKTSDDPLPGSAVKTIDSLKAVASVSEFELMLSCYEMTGPVTEVFGYHDPIEQVLDLYHQVKPHSFWAQDLLLTLDQIDCPKSVRVYPTLNLDGSTIVEIAFYNLDTIFLLSITILNT